MTWDANRAQGFLLISIAFPTTGSRSQQGFIFILAAIIVIGGPIGWFMARNALHGVEEVTQTVTEIANGALVQPVTARSRGDELDRLAQAFNRMLDRIQALIISMREVTENLVHDL